jgi:hypothetical protein
MEWRNTVKRCADEAAARKARGKEMTKGNEEMENYRMALAYISKQSTDQQSRELAETALNAFPADRVPQSPQDTELLGNLPLQYVDGPDYCTVTDATGGAFALTVQPELMQLMERAALSLSRPVRERQS